MQIWSIYREGGHLISKKISHINIGVFRLEAVNKDWLTTAVWINGNHMEYFIHKMDSLYTRMQTKKQSDWTLWQLALEYHTVY